jgi:hypothetical protein
MLLNNVVKRALVSLLATALILVALTGCGSTNNNENGDQSPTTPGENPLRPEATDKSKPTLEPQEFDPAEYTSSITYDNLARTPDDYKGKRFVMAGRVIQVMEENSGTTLRIATDGSYGDVVLAHLEKGLVTSRILEDDKITFYGVSAGLYSYESILGRKVTVPLVYINQVVQGSVSQTGTVFNAEGIAQALEIQELHYNGSYSRYVFLIVKNTSEFTLDISGIMETFDAAGNIISHNDSSEDAVAPETETILAFRLDEKYASTKYEISVSEGEYFEPVTQNLSYTSTTAKNKEIVTVTNNGDIAAQFVEGHALFIKDDVIVYYDKRYFTDDDSEIKPGKSVTKEVKSLEPYDTMKIIFTGRGD